jgi:hypothetical protein
MAIRAQRLTSTDTPPSGATGIYPTAFAKAVAGWVPPAPADPLATATNQSEARCFQCGTRLESLTSYQTCPFCGSDNPQGA